MNLYKKIRKRTALKYIGKNDVDILREAQKLKIGDLIQNCFYEKLPITKIVPVYSRNIRGKRVIVDFDIWTDSKKCQRCSFIHCCDIC